MYDLKILRIISCKFRLVAEIHMTNALKRIELRKKGLIQSLFPRRKAG